MTQEMWFQLLPNNWKWLLPGAGWEQVQCWKRCPLESKACRESTGNCHQNSRYILINSNVTLFCNFLNSVILIADTVDKLMNKISVWEKERNMPFLYDGVREHFISLSGGFLEYIVTDHFLLSSDALFCCCYRCHWCLYWKNTKL